MVAAFSGGRMNQGSAVRVPSDSLNCDSRITIRRLFFARTGLRHSSARYPVNTRPQFTPCGELNLSKLNFLISNRSKRRKRTSSTSGFYVSNRSFTLPPCSSVPRSENESNSTNSLPSDRVQIRILVPGPFPDSLSSSVMGSENVCS